MRAEYAPTWTPAMHRAVGYWLSAIFSIYVLVSQSVAATVTKTGNSGDWNHISPVCTVKFEGAIIAGDADRLISSFDKESNESVCLNSPGGSFEEALSMAAYLFENGVSTIVERDASCFSACALIFMAGSVWTENVTDTSRYLHVRGHLSFHAPYIPEAGGMASKALVDKAYQAGIVAVGKLLRIIQNSSTPSREEVFPQALLAQMLSKGPSESHDIDTVRKVVESNISLFGLATPAHLTKDMVCTACGAVNPYFPFVKGCGENGQGHYSETVKDGQLQFEAGLIGIEEAGFTCKLKLLEEGFIMYEVLDMSQSRMRYGTIGTWHFYPPETLISALPPAK